MIVKKLSELGFMGCFGFVGFSGNIFRLEVCEQILFYPIYIIFYNNNVRASIAALQKKWSALFPDAPFDYNFLDDSLKRIYQSELQLRQASYTAATLAFIIVLPGVIGLISLSIQKRTKEIGIRKVLGSSVTGIISLFLKEFLLISLCAGVVACPIAYFIMRGWLNNYAYRISLTIQPFIIATLVLAAITVILICVQTVKAALANPVNSLRSE